MPRQQVSKDTAPDAIRQFDAQNFFLVIAHGYEYLEAREGVDRPFKGNAGEGEDRGLRRRCRQPQFCKSHYDLSGASYQLGIIAAKVTKTGKLGFIGGAPFRPSPQ